MSEDIIEIVNKDYTFEFLQNNYEIKAENVFSIDYNMAVNIPSINNVFLKGNKTLSDLGIQAAGDYAENDLSNLDDAGECHFANPSLSNLDTVGQEVLSNKADVDLSNLSSTGQALFTGRADVDLSNLSSTGQALFTGRADVDLSNLSSTGQALFAGKADVATTLSGYGIVDGADISASNFNSAGKALITNFSMPSSSCTSLTAGASGSTYTATKCGYFVAQIVTSTNNNEYLIASTDKNLGYQMWVNRASSGMKMFLPVSAGDILSVSYSAGATLSLWFIKANGEV